MKKQEERPITTVYNGVSQMGRSTMRVRCPFCQAVLSVFIWSFYGCGKRCSCGAVLHAVPYLAFKDLKE